MLNVKEGETVAIYLPNTTEYYYIGLGIMLCKGIASPSNPSLDEDAIKSQLLDLNPKVVIVTMDNWSKITRALKAANLKDSCKLVVLSLCEDVPCQEGEFSLLDLLSQARQLPALPSELNASFDPEEVCVVLWSSGTTGRPKGVQLQYKILQLCLQEHDFEVPGATMFTISFFHVSALALLLNSLTKERPVYFFPAAALEKGQDFSDKIFRAIHRFKPVLWGSITHLLQKLFQDKNSSSYDLSSIIIIAPMGSAATEDAFQQLKSKFPNLVAMFNGLAMTEFPQRIAGALAPGSLGFLSEDVEIKIIDPETGKVCGPNETGEILAKSDYKMKGYLNRPEDDAKFFRPDGFVHTGDLAHYDNDFVLYHDGRLKGLIKHRHFVVSPDELEKIIMKHPGVHEVCVFGIPDVKSRELVAAAVVRKEGSEVDGDTIAGLVEESVKEDEKHKLLTGGVIFTDELPRNANGKVVRAKLVERAQELLISREKLYSGLDNN